MLRADERLERWREYERSSGWLGEAARVIIPKLEAEIAVLAKSRTGVTGG